MKDLVQISKKTKYNEFRDDNPFENASKLLYHADRLSEYIKTDSTFPINIEINLIDVCNQACRWCISMYSHISNPSLSAEEKKSRLSIVNESFSAPNNRKIQQGIDIKYLKKFLEDIKRLGTKAIVYSGGGEPMIFKEADEAIQHASNLGFDVGIMSNGQFKKDLIPIIGEMAKWIRISLDTFNAEAYEYQKFTKGFEQVIENIKELVKYPVKVGLNMNIAEWNYKEIIDFAFRGKELGVDYVQYRPVLKLPFEQKYNDPYRTTLGEDLLEKIEILLIAAEQLSDDKFKAMVSWDKFKDIKKDDFGRNYKACEGHNFMNVLGSDGKWQVCMYYLGDDRFTYGNIYENSADEIWKSNKKKQVDEFTKTKLDLSKCQVSCRLHQKNKLIHLVKNRKEEADINFV